MIHCAITTHAEDVPAAAYATVDGVCRPRCQMHIARARRDGCTVRLRPLTPEPETVTVTRAPPLALPDPEPTMSDTLQADAVASTPLNRNGITPNRHLPLILRHDADAHPELCRVADCTGKVKARGVCDQHLTALGKAGDTAILLPRADRSEAARKAAAVRAMVKRKPVAPTPVVEQPAPAAPVEDGDGPAPAPVAPRVLERIGPDYYANTDGPTVSVWKSTDMPGTWCALDTAEPGLTRHPTPEAAAAHLGARLGARLLDPVCSEMEPTAPTPTREQELQAQVEEQAGQIRRAEEEIARMREMIEYNTPPGATLSERLATSCDQRQDALDELSEIAAALDKFGKVNAPEQTKADRVRALIRYVGEVEKEGGHYATLCSEAHDALSLIDVPSGTLPDRIRALASRTAPPPDQRLQAIAAELLADLDDVTDAGEAWGIHLVRALRLAVGVES